MTEPKRRKIEPPPLRRNNSLSATKNDEVPALSTVHALQTSMHLKIQQAKHSAVAQAQQDGCMGNFKVFDSQFGNFLVPVIPTAAELGG